jgi:hypothetical protein
MRIRLAFFVVLALAAAVAPAGQAAPPSLHFTVFTHTDLPLGDITWTGSRFLYDSENTGQLETSDATGHGFTPFATFDQGGEEMRCLPAPARPAYWPDGIYCHTPDNRIVRFARDGSSMTPLAQLPPTGNSDGSIAFDTVGRFGYAIVAATGGSASTGGQVFTIRKSGKVTAIGSYDGPGGAEHVAIAPAKFGSASGWVLLSIDQDGGIGRLLAMDPHGTVKVLVPTFPSGINPIAAISASPAKRASGLPAAGLYLADTNSQNVYFTPASGLAAFAGDVIVGTEKPGAAFWIVRPVKSGFQAVALASDLPTTQVWNLEGGAYVP